MPIFFETRLRSSVIIRLRDGRFGNRAILVRSNGQVMRKNRCKQVDNWIGEKCHEKSQADKSDCEIVERHMRRFDENIEFIESGQPTEPLR